MNCDRFCQEDLVEPWDSPWEGDRKKVLPMLPRSHPHYCTRLHTPRRALDFQYSAEDVTIAEPSPHHVLLLQTARRPQSTLGATLDSLREAGIRDWPGPRILASDGPADQISSTFPLNQDGWITLHSPPPQLGAARAFVRALRLAFAVDPDLELLTFLEDDIELCKNALAYMAQVAVPPDVSLITWFTYNYDWSTPRHEIAHPTPQEIAFDQGRGVLGVRPSRFFILTQACTLTRLTIEKICNCPLAAKEWPKREGHDELISWVLGDAPYATHFPIMVQHAGGLNSAVSVDLREHGDLSNAQSGDRSSPLYVGREFDALGLLPR
jgi:hypothetical protein